MSRILVVDQERRPLMPCTPARARMLLKSRKAAILRRFPLVWMPQPPLRSVCGPDRVALRGWIDAQSRPGPSGDDRAATPSVSGIQPGLNHVGC